MRGVWMLSLLLVLPTLGAGAVPAPSAPSPVASVVDLLPVAGPEDVDTLREAVALVSLLDRHAWPGDGAPFQAPARALPGEALVELAAQRGFEVDAEARAGLDRLDALPPKERTALAAMISAFVALDRTVEAAYPPAASEREAFARGFDVVSILRAREAFLLALADFEEVWAEGSGSRASQACVPVELYPIYLFEMEGCTSFYTADYILLLDVGGDDEYRNNAGGTRVGGTLVMGDPCDPLPVHLAAALVDFGGQDDHVTDDLCGLNGGGFGGAGILVDLASGGDEYHAGDFGVNGGAYFGVGLLLDAMGLPSDWNNYRVTQAAGGNLGTNGGGYAGGSGMVLDTAGDDLFLSNDLFGYSNGAACGGAVLLGCGFPSITSTGALVNLFGADSYHGTNGVGDHGGVGLLLDLLGGDNYNGAWDETVVPKGTGAQLDVQ